MTNQKVVERKQEEKQEQQQPKICPFLNRPCILDECAIRVTIQQQVMGLAKTINICPFPALVMMMASRPQPPPPQKLNFPGLRG